MASSFKILTHKQKYCLHLELAGSFDGSSAMELINVLKKNGRQYNKIIVNTDRLKSIHPFGQEVFLSSLSGLNGIKKCLSFTGEYAGQVVPAKAPIPQTG
jgi:hypothetical protein